VETMRQPNSGGAAVSAPAARQSSSIGDAAMLRLAAVAEALAAERAQVFLEPILKLSDEEARHFEISVHLTTANGQVLDARVLAEGARGAGLLPLLDALGIRHSAGFALKLERRGRDGAVFSEVAGESLESDSFVSDVADRHAQGIADRLVLTFAQSEVRGLGPAQFTALSRLRQLGFRFAMQNVADLDMDFEALAAVGFEFVKLDATVFLDGLQLAGAHIPASDLTRHFVELGLDVIVGRIDAETVRARVLACGAEFGQGPLFGAPRVIPTAHTVAGGVAA
jgi:cyclic-di-GMP phosphodiesterase TipF (flagellum assembly factor)